jgi:hypothetical protein
MRERDLGLCLRLLFALEGEGGSASALTALGACWRARGAGGGASRALTAPGARSRAKAGGGWGHLRADNAGGALEGQGFSGQGRLCAYSAGHTFESEGGSGWGRRRADTPATRLGGGCWCDRVSLRYVATLGRILLVRTTFFFFFGWFAVLARTAAPSLFFGRPGRRMGQGCAGRHVFVGAPQREAEIEIRVDIQR